VEEERKKPFDSHAALIHIQYYDSSCQHPEAVWSSRLSKFTVKFREEGRREGCNMAVTWTCPPPPSERLFHGLVRGGRCHLDPVD
jgi:hypothetical protein